MPRWMKKWPVNSDSGQSYVVSLADDGETWGCSCPAWKFKRRTCRHILQIQLEISHAELKALQKNRPTLPGIMAVNDAKQDAKISPPPPPRKRETKYSEDGRLKRRVEMD